MNDESSLQSEHRRFLNTYYGWSRHFYDFSRKYYLLGRDRELRRLLSEEWQSLVEVGPGTGRNLLKLKQKRPRASYFGVEACDAMLRHARARCTFAQFDQSFAETCDIERLVGKQPDRILFSYCLSMVGDPKAAIENALRALSPSGKLVVVDFGHAESLPRWFQTSLRDWLLTFRVRPPTREDYLAWGAEIETTWGGYVIHARWSAGSRAQARDAARPQSQHLPNVASL